ncbi:MAG: hypothetical protein LBB68_11685 [Treponema sp.]|nr:hypothetical protein [Treponema sp.]
MGAGSVCGRVLLVYPLITTGTLGARDNLEKAGEHQAWYSDIDYNAISIMSWYINQ